MPVQTLRDGKINKNTIFLENEDNGVLCIHGHKSLKIQPEQSIKVKIVK